MQLQWRGREFEMSVCVGVRGQVVAGVEGETPSAGVTGEDPSLRKGAFLGIIQAKIFTLKQ